jgi:hypothetical protein
MNPPPLESPLPILPLRTSKLAIASLVLGVMSAGCTVFTGIPSVILGIMALAKIRKQPHELGGHGLAIAGIVCSGVLGLFFFAIIATLAVPAYTGVQERARMMQAVNNARQIAIVMKNYAGDHQGLYPDAAPSAPQTANDAFRELFKAELLEDELIFSAPNSPYLGDHNIGEAPDFKDALIARENHWCLVKGLSDASNGTAPLVFENPVEMSWPPSWNMDASGQAVPGRGWKSGKIVVVRNDASATGQSLSGVRGDRVTLKPSHDGKDVFTHFSHQGEFLDVLR